MIGRWMGRAKYLLVFPAFSAYRRRARRSLRWRLAGSYLLVLFLSLASALAIVAGLAGFATVASNPAAEEPADDARAAARLLNGLGLVPPTPANPPSKEVTDALASLAAGRVTLYRANDQTRFDVRPSSMLRRVRTISVAGPDGQIWASSDRGREGSSIGSTLPAEQILRAIRAGSTDLKRNSRVPGVDPGVAGVGAYPLAGTDGSFVWVEKSAILSPSGGRLWWAELRAAIAAFSVTAFIIFLPAMVVVTVFALRSARTIVAPIERVNAAARALAAGDLHQRIRNPGEDETAALARSFDAMAEQLGGAIDELNQQRARAESLLDQNRQLVANVAHELRTPMAIVRGHLEVLADEESESAGGQARLERLEPVLRETTRLELLIDDLFRASTADATAAPVVLAEVDVAAVARAAVEPLVTIAKREAGVTLVLSMSEAVIAVRADPDRLTQVIQILVRNALRHTPDGGMVLVEVEKDPLPDRLARIVVRDSGEGIPEEDLPHIFARFYRGRNARGSATGAGLGLAIAHEFVDGMGGVLTAANDPVQGAVFTVTLPLAL